MEVPWFLQLFVMFNSKESVIPLLPLFMKMEIEAFPHLVMGHNLPEHASGQPKVFSDKNRGLSFFSGKCKS